MFGKVLNTPLDQGNKINVVIPGVIIESYQVKVSLQEKFLRYHKELWKNISTWQNQVSPTNAVTKDHKKCDFVKNVSFKCALIVD